MTDASENFGYQIVLAPDDEVCRLYLRHREDDLAGLRPERDAASSVYLTFAPDARREAEVLTRTSQRLDAVVQHVLIHEIGHHFGLSDDDMDRIERSAD